MILLLVNFKLLLINQISSLHFYKLQMRILIGCKISSFMLNTQALKQKLESLAQR
jgi:hypothetical protein